MKPEFLPKTPEGRRWRLAEECGEVVRALSKIGRFGAIGIGYDGHENNTEALKAELADLRHAIEAVEHDLSS